MPDYAARLADAAAGTRLVALEAPGETDPDVAAVFTDLLRAAAGAFGREVPFRRFAGLEAVYAMGDVVSKVEAATLHGRWIAERPERYSQAVFARTEPGLHVPAPRYLEALALRGRVLQAFLDEVMAEAEVLLCPTVPVATPTRAEADMERGERVFPVVAALMRPFSYLGLPVLSMPIGLDRTGRSARPGCTPWRSGSAPRSACRSGRARSPPAGETSAKRLADGVCP